MDYKKKLEEALVKFRALVEKVNGESRNYTEDELKEKEGLGEEIERLKVAIDDEKRAMETQNFLNEPVVEPVEPPASQVTRSNDPDLKVKRDEKDDEKGNYRSQFDGLGDFLKAVKRVGTTGIIDQRLADEHRAAAGANSAVGTDGGFLLSQPASETLMKKTFETGVLSRRCKSLTLPKGDTYSMKILKENSRADGYRAGGLSVYYAGEAEAMTATSQEFEKLDFKLKKLTGLSYVTDEQLENENTLAQELHTSIPDEFGYKLDSSILTGLGAKDPLGWLNSPSKVAVPKVMTQTAKTINFTNIVAMISRLWTRSAPNAAWFFNQDIYPQLMALSFPTSAVPLWLPGNSIAGQPHNTLMGIPIFPIEQAKTLGSEGDIILADFSQYQLITRGGIKSDSSIHVQFLTNQTAFRWVMKVDGQPLWINALTPAEGTATVSPCITLAARA